LLIRYAATRDEVARAQLTNRPSNYIARFFDLRPLICCNFAVFLITKLRPWWQRSGSDTRKYACLETDCLSLTRRKSKSPSLENSIRAQIKGSMTGLAGPQHQELECEYIRESKATELRGWRVSDVYIP
jgi:hypothetical protein